MKLALISVAVLLAFVVGISIVASNDPSSDSGGLFEKQCPSLLGPCDAPPTTSTHAYLGGSFKTIPTSVASELDLVEGVEINTMGKGTSAAEAGLHAASGSRTVNGHSYPTGGDVITAVDGRKVTSAEELQSVIDAKRPGDTVVIRYSRGGSRLSDTVQVKLASSSY